MWETVIRVLAEYGPVAVIAGALMSMLAIILRGFMNGLKEDRSNYMKIIEEQRITQNNHLLHLEEAINKQGIGISKQGGKLESGIDKICDAIQNQTEILKMCIEAKGENNVE
jgi:hypothetical protein